MDKDKSGEIDYSEMATSFQKLTFRVDAEEIFQVNFQDVTFPPTHRVLARGIVR